MKRSTFVRGLLACGALPGAHRSLAQSPPAAEAAYPSRPVRVVVPYPPGAINDVLARWIAERLQPALGQPVIVDNRAGAGGVIGTQSVAAAAPDGYTLLQVPAAHAINATLVPKLPYDTVRSFSYVTLVASSPFLLVAGPALQAKNFPELVAQAKARPGRLSFASSGNGGTAHLMGEMLNEQAGIDVLHVPYKGTGQAMTDLIGGQVHYTFSTYPGAAPHIKGGRVRVLAVTGRRRWPAFPDVPTIAESGYPDYDAAGWWGYVAPAGTPAAIVERLQREVVRVLAEPALRAKLADEGLEVHGSTPDQFRAHVEREIATWGKIIRRANIKAD